MRRIVGAAGVKKVTVMMGDVQNVTVTDSGSFVRLSLSANSFPAELTPEEARHISGALSDAANRAEQKTGESN